MRVCAQASSGTQTRPLGRPPRERDAGGLSSENRWNLMKEGIYGANEGSEGARATEFCQS